MLGLFSTILLFQAHNVYGEDEELPIITIDFVSGNIIDLDESPQLIRADVQIQNYDPRDGYHYMQIIRLSDREVIKDTAVFPTIVGENLAKAQILHYLESNEDEETLIGEYALRVYSQFGPGENAVPFFITRSSEPVILNPVEDSEESDIENLPPSEPRIPSWVHNIFVWYADETISEHELLIALEFLINQDIIDVNSD